MSQLRLDPALAPTLDEFAYGAQLRPQPGIAPLARTQQTPRDAIEAVLRPALQRGSAHVLFSGGADSSLLLAVATSLARREGLPLPIPVSHRYPGDVESHEDDWQELLVAHLRLPDWVRVDATGRHDLLGPAGRSVLARHGATLSPHWWIGRLPPEAGGVPIEAEPAPETHTTLITGVGGDELFPEPPRHAVNRLLGGDPRPLAHPRQLRRELHGRRWRLDIVARWLVDAHPWIRPSARTTFAARRAEEMVDISGRYTGYVDHLWRSRGTQGARERARLAAAESGADHLAPFQTAAVLAAFARRYGWRYPASRTQAYREIAGADLPDRSLRRDTKATAGTAFIGPETCAWLQQWDGSGPDEAVIDGEQVRERLLRLGRGQEGGDGRVIGLAARAYTATEQ